MGPPAVGGFQSICPGGSLGVITPSRGARLSSGAGLQQGEEAVNAIIPEFDKTLKAQGKTGEPTIKELALS